MESNQILLQNSPTNTYTITKSDKELPKIKCTEVSKIESTYNPKVHNSIAASNVTITYTVRDNWVRIVAKHSVAKAIAKTEDLIRDVQFMNNSSFVLATCGDNNITIWDVSKTAATYLTLKHPDVKFLRCAWNDTEDDELRCFAAISDDKHLRIWFAKSLLSNYNISSTIDAVENETHIFTSDLHNLIFYDETRLIVSDSEGKIVLVDMDSSIKKQFTPHDGKIVDSTFFTQDKKFLITSSDNNSVIKVWNFEEFLHNEEFQSPPVQTIIISFPGENLLAFDPIGSYLVSGGTSHNTLNVFHFSPEASGFSCVKQFNSESCNVGLFCLTANGTIEIYCRQPGYVRYFNYSASLQSEAEQFSNSKRATSSSSTPTVNLNNSVPVSQLVPSTAANSNSILSTSSPSYSNLPVPANTLQFDPLHPSPSASPSPISLPRLPGPVHSSSQPNFSPLSAAQHQPPSVSHPPPGSQPLPVQSPIQLPVQPPQSSPSVVAQPSPVPQPKPQPSQPVQQVPIPQPPPATSHQQVQPQPAQPQVAQPIQPIQPQAAQPIQPVQPIQSPAPSHAVQSPASSQASQSQESKSSNTPQQRAKQAPNQQENEGESTQEDDSDLRSDDMQNKKNLKNQNQKRNRKGKQQDQKYVNKTPQAVQLNPNEIKILKNNDPAKQQPNQPIKLPDIKNYEQKKVQVKSGPMLTEPASSLTIEEKVDKIYEMLRNFEKDKEAKEKELVDKVVARLEKSPEFHNVISKVLDSKTQKLIDAVKQGVRSDISNIVREPVSKEVKDFFTTTINPAFESSCERMFRQIDETFQQGIQQHFTKLKQNSTASTTQQLTKIADNLSRVCETLVENSMAPPVPVVVPESPSLPSSPLPAALPPNEVSIINQYLSSRSYQAAFYHALGLENLDMVLYTCSKLKPSDIFLSNGPNQLTQPVLLCLLQQLSNDLPKSAHLKINWLSECLIKLDLSDAQIAPCAPQVLSQILFNIEKSKQTVNDPSLYPKLQALMQTLAQLRNYSVAPAFVKY